MNLLLDLLAAAPEMQRITEQIKKRRSRQVLAGLSGSQKSCFLSSLKVSADTGFLVAAADALTAKKIYEDCQTFLNELYLLPYLEKEQLSDIPIEHIAVFCRFIERLLEGRKVMAVTPAANVAYGFRALEKLREQKILLQAGERLDLKNFLKALTEAGYVREELTELPGQFSIRGGIIDVFLYQKTQPLRLELFDEEIDSIRFFDPLSQRSTESLKEFMLYFLGTNIFSPSGGNLTDYFTSSGLVVLDEPDSWEKPNFYAAKTAEIASALVVKYLPGQDDDFVFQSSTAGAFQQRLDVLVSQLQEWRQKNVVFLFAATRERKQRLAELLQSEGIGVTEKPEGKIGEIIIIRGNLHEGFHDLESHVVVVADQEIFGVRKKTRQKGGCRQQFENGLRVNSITDLQAGDYVVHLQQGIGQYLGIETIGDSDGMQKDYLAVAYANDAKLYIPTDQMDKLQRYVGVEGQKPRLSKIGGSEWSRLKKKVSSSVAKLAEDLLALYAAREMSQGFAFSPDCAWQKQFEDAFPFEETPDQLKAIAAVKKDMERIQPMDRLLCGDVGYGKTEVAMRAAFKAVNDSKQVAVLVPTTILAQQHLNTFRERFREYPFTIEMLSRFRSAKEQSKILKDVARGTVDIIIGTHRLVQKDIEFKDLGLIIVDEEQRFGVAHKERLKQLKKNVDILTLTATPIPRTLYMAMVNIRSMSVIETPPEDRFPIQTYIIEYDEHTIKEAIRYELARQGQVYFLHNRVESIDKTATQLGVLVPEARIGVAHGQMSEDELERVMWAFIRGEYDVLVCTTIIETGLDVPNVNTLIIDQADHIGLASLYQLRGRVGRSSRVAYAYLTYRKNKVVSEVAQKRLRVMKDFTALGSGFKIAMRDLEIRGAGNILGAEQHGHMASIGFELYAKMLKSAVRKLQGEENREEEKIAAAVELKVSAYIPESYVADQKRKIEIYKKIANVLDLAEINEVEDELEDRFGTMPEETLNLLDIARARLLAERVKITEIVQEGEKINLLFHGAVKPDGNLLSDLLERYHGRIIIRNRKNLEIGIKSSNLKDRELFSLLHKILTDLNMYYAGERE